MNLFERASGAASAETLFSDQTLIAAMVRFESELALAQAQLNLIPADAAGAIHQACNAFTGNPAAMAEAATLAGTLAVPLVAALRAQVATINPDAARWLHHGSTSQDVLDTALVLCTRAALEALDDEIGSALQHAAALARQHRATPMLARTLLQAAGITTFGYKAALWHHALQRHRSRLQTAARDGLCVSLGGALGNLAVYGESGEALRQTLAERLRLRDPGHCWHTHRQDWLALASEAALLCATLSKIAGDIALLAQTEVAEVREAHVEGRGASSAMPHKRNPVLTLQVLSLTQGAPQRFATLLAAQGQEHERALGGWQSEQAHWPGLFRTAVAATRTLSALLASVEVDTGRCAANIAALQGVTFAEAVAESLSGALGKPAAQSLVAELCQRALREGTPLRDLLSERLSTEPRWTADLGALFNVERAAGASSRQVTMLLGKPH